MFAYLKGLIAGKSPNRVIIDCSGVGYDVSIPLSTYEKLGNIGDAGMLHIHSSWSDAGMFLYGFYSAEELQLFRLLISISGIGPKSALCVLSGMSVSRFVEAVRDGNSTLISQVPGLGPKTSQRIIVELKDRVDAFGYGVSRTADGGSSGTNREAEEALVSLGFKIGAVRKALNKVSEETTDLKIIIKEAIKFLYKSR
ncbi:MAG: Holliday junction branch migration protein RuvA [Candidatus Cloacimonetes bacterium]|nr:Holliday junction branch migration protein RuvA [Candidatus Cloacimonadota bacterium]